MKNFSVRGQEPPGTVEPEPPKKVAAPQHCFEPSIIALLRRSENINLFTCIKHIPYRHQYFIL